VGIPGGELSTGNREGKHVRSKKAKKSYIDYFCACIMLGTFENLSQYTTKSLVSHRERPQTTYNILAEYIGYLVIEDMPYKKTCKSIDKEFQYLKWVKMQGSVPC
jgi:hypothetical protein